VRRHPNSKDVYLRLLVRLYRFLARRTSSTFNAVVLKRLCMSRVNRPPVSLGKVIKHLTLKHNADKGKLKAGKVAAIVGTVTDDPRLFEIPKITVCALRFTKGARARILRAGGECLTFDQLALRHPTGNNVLLLRGPRKARQAYRYFGIPGAPHSKTRPRTRGKSRKIEAARGRRSRCGFKV
jgi:large subunit ribosomal protein L18e